MDALAARRVRHGGARSYLAAGLVTDNFRSGDTGFIVFNVAAANGTPMPGQAANLRAIYTDRRGSVVFVDNAIEDRDAGEYQSSFDTGTAGWNAGPITVSFAWTGAGSMRALSTGFTLNSLATTLRTNGTEFTAGQSIAFSGSVAQVTTLATGTVQTTPLAGSTVTLTLLDGDGQPLGVTQVTSNLQGSYAGTITAPGSARGQVALVAESAYQDPATVLGTKEWYGRAVAALKFPGNIPPVLALSATPDANRKASGSFLMAIDATVTDADGTADVSSITLTLVDGKGRLLGRWLKSDFSAADGRSWTFARVPRVTGQSPWTVTLTAEDSAGQAVTTSRIIK